MKKFLNKDVSNVVGEMISGYVSAYRKYYKRIGDYTAIMYKGHRKDKVAIVIGGGSGHEPLFLGLCGAGLADAVASGNICASPNPEVICETAKAVDQGKGVLFIYGCYAGDNLNFDMGEELCWQNGIKTAHVRVWDDIASAPKERITDRRGIAGDVFTFKIAGAAADAGLSLEAVLRVTEKARDSINTIGVAIRPGILPGNSKPAFELAEDEMEYGMGLHGEPGIERTRMQPAEVIVNRMYQELKAEMNLKAGDEICVMVNGLGSTPLLELNLVYYDLYRLLIQDGIIVYDTDIGTYCTCMEMGGVSVTIMRLDTELKKYYNMPCYTPYYAKGVFHSMDWNDRDDNENVNIVESGAVDTTTVIKRSRAGELNELNAEDTRNMLLYTADRIIASKSYLTEIDSAIGDGDHGIGMAAGMQKVKRKLLTMTEERNAYKLFEEAGNTMLMSMGGASGVIFGSLFMAGAKNMEPSNILTGADFLEMEKKSLEAIQERGKAKAGDKTMVDALAPAIDAMEAHKQASFLEIMKFAEEGARYGMENTKNYAAKFGRAKSLMERSIGHQDAGATSVYLIFLSMREYVEYNMQ